MIAVWAMQTFDGEGAALVKSAIQGAAQRETRDPVARAFAVLIWMVEATGTPWGLREYPVRDPNGYHLRFGEPVTPRASSAPAKEVPEGVRLVEEALAAGWPFRFVLHGPELLARIHI